MLHGLFPFCLVSSEMGLSSTLTNRPLRFLGGNRQQWVLTGLLFLAYQMHRINLRSKVPEEMNLMD